MESERRSNDDHFQRTKYILGNISNDLSKIVGLLDRAADPGTFGNRRRETGYYTTVPALYSEL